MRKSLYVPTLRLWRCHRTEDAAYAGVAFVVEGTVGSMDDFIEEIPYVLFRPMEYRRYEDRVLAVDAVYLVVGTDRKLVLVELAFELFHFLLFFAFAPREELR